MALLCPDKGFHVEILGLFPFLSLPAVVYTFPGLKCSFVSANKMVAIVVLRLAPLGVIQPFKSLSVKIRGDKQPFRISFSTLQ